MNDRRDIRAHEKVLYLVYTCDKCGSMLFTDTPQKTCSCGGRLQLTRGEEET